MREQNYQFTWNHPDQKFAGTVGFKAASPQDWIASDLKVTNTGKWHYLAATYDGLKLRSYTNGTPLSFDIYAGGPLSETTSAKIGRHANGTDPKNFFDGDVDEVRIAQGSHSNAWIAAQYRSMMDKGFVTFGPEEANPTQQP